MKNLNEVQIMCYLAEGCGRDMEMFSGIARRMFNRFLFDGIITKEEYLNAMKCKEDCLRGIENGKTNC